MFNFIKSFFEKGNFLPASQLGITEKERTALIDVLRGLESGKYVHVDRDDEDTKVENNFDMSIWLSEEYNKCEIKGCIGGWATYVYRTLFNEPSWNGFESKLNTDYHLTDRDELSKLFYPTDSDLPEVDDGYGEMESFPWENITAEHATQALRNFLTRGSAKWDEVIVV